MKKREMKFSVIILNIITGLLWTFITVMKILISTAPDWVIYLDGFCAIIWFFVAYINYQRYQQQKSEKQYDEE